MKIAFDEHVPPVLVKVFKVLAESKFVITAEFHSAKEFSKPSDEDDAPWLERFAEAGGNYVITGDKGIRSKPHERLAYQQAGLSLFCFSSTWNNKNSFFKTAHLIHWWPKIEKHINTGGPAKCWQIPCQWNYADFKDITGPGMTMEKKEKEVAE